MKHSVYKYHGAYILSEINAYRVKIVIWPVNEIIFDRQQSNWNLF